jgi:hypothetical protein
MSPHRDPGIIYDLNSSGSTDNAFRDPKASSHGALLQEGYSNSLMRFFSSLSVHYPRCDAHIFIFQSGMFHEMPLISFPRDPRFEI